MSGEELVEPQSCRECGKSATACGKAPEFCCAACSESRFRTHDPVVEASSGWEVYDLATVHVVPEQGSDAVMHDLDMDCICGPTVDFSETRPLITHHSLDGREASE